MLALVGAAALTLPAPALAYDETPEAIAEAVAAARASHGDMAETFKQRELKNGTFRWKDGVNSVDRVVVNLTEQLAYAYNGDELVAVSTISSGREGHPTPVGIFPIMAKSRTYYSKKYDNAPMPYMQRLDDYGIAMHAGHLPGRPASHGCIRLPEKFAARLFAATQVGTPVLIGV
jgi:lipoprotein-anchoring transpeptidase ErfK/SrfK